MPAPTTDRLATRLRQVRLARRADDAPPLAHTWDLIRVALAVPAATVAVVAVIIGFVKLVAGGGMGGLGTAAAAGWLAVNQVPLSVGGVTVGALPLLPTVVMVVAVALVCLRASRSADSIAEVATIAGAALGGTLLTTALALAVVADGAAVSSIGQPDPLPAFGFTLGVQLLGVLAGVGGRCLQPLLAEFDLPVTDRVGARAGVLALGVLAVGGALLVFAGLVTHWQRIGDLIARGHSFDGYLGLTALSMLYLPNVVVGAIGLGVGAHAQVGTVTFDSLASDPGAVPPLPILGIVPEVGAGPVGLVTFAVPIAAAAAVGWYCRSVDVVKHLRAVVVAAAVAAAGVVIGLMLSSGEVGELGRVWVSPASAGVYTFAWIVVVGGMVAGAHALLPGVRGGGDDPYDFDALLASDDFADLEVVDDPDAAVESDPDESEGEEVGEPAADSAPGDADERDESTSATAESDAQERTTDTLPVVDAESGDPSTRR